MRFVTFKKEQNNFGKYSAFDFTLLTYVFFTSNSAVFADGVQEYFFPQEAGYPSYATRCIGRYLTF